MCVYIYKYSYKLSVEIFFPSDAPPFSEADTSNVDPSDPKKGKKVNATFMICVGAELNGILCLLYCVFLSDDYISVCGSE